MKEKNIGADDALRTASVSAAPGGVGDSKPTAMSEKKSEEGRAGSVSKEVGGAGGAEDQKVNE